MTAGKRDFSLVALGRKIKTVIDKKKIGGTVIDPLTPSQFNTQNKTKGGL
jgi:hypothetical protein